MNRRPRRDDIPGLLFDLTIAAALIACLIWAVWALAQLSDWN